MAPFTATPGTSVVAPPLRGVVRGLVLATTAVLVLQAFAPELGPHLSLSRSGFRPWQPLTAMFCHASGLHFAFNMMLLWMLGSSVELALGPRRFLTLYLTSGVAANLAWVLVCPPNLHTVGSSGAVFGVLYAFARLLPEQVLLLFFVLPMRARNFALLCGALELFGTVRATGDGVAHAVHLFGAAAAALYLELVASGRAGGFWRASVESLRFRYRTRHLRVIEGGAAPTGIRVPRRRGRVLDDGRPWDRGAGGPAPAPGAGDSPFLRDPDDKGPVIN